MKRVELERVVEVLRTVKELAKDLGVSDQTVRNEIQRQHIEVAVDRCAHIITDEDAKRVGKAITERKEGKTAPKSKVKTEHSNKAESKVKMLQREIDDKNRQIEFLRSEVDALHEQTRTLSNTISELSASLAEVTTSLKAIQALQTGRKLIEQKEEEQAKKRWQFWKR